MRKPYMEPTDSKKKCRDSGFPRDCKQGSLGVLQCGSILFWSHHQGAYLFLLKYVLGGITRTPINPVLGPQGPYSSLEAYGP